MATRWRRRRMCLLLSGDVRSLAVSRDEATPAAIRTISATRAFLETNARPALGDSISLSHPEAGLMPGFVEALHVDGVALRFDGGEQAMAFAMAAIAADMSDPG